MSQPDWKCGFPNPTTGRPCGTTATHEVKYEGEGRPVPACPAHRLEASMDLTRPCAIRRRRLR